MPWPQEFTLGYGDWTEVNADSGYAARIRLTDSHFILQGRGVGGAGITRAIGQAVGLSTPWKLTAKAAGMAFRFFNGWGILASDSVSGRVIWMMFQAGVGLAVYLCSAHSTVSSNPVTVIPPVPGTDVVPRYLRIHDNGTDLKFSYSEDRVSFIEVYSAGRTAWLTNGCDEFWIGGWDQNGGEFGIAVDWVRAGDDLSDPPSGGVILIGEGL
jgi:hypothetical protein